MWIGMTNIWIVRDPPPAAVTPYSTLHQVIKRLRRNWYVFLYLYEFFLFSIIALALLLDWCRGAMVQQRRRGWYGGRKDDSRCSYWPTAACWRCASTQASRRTWLSIGSEVAKWRRCSFIHLSIQALPANWPLKHYFQEDEDNMFIGSGLSRKKTTAIRIASRIGGGSSPTSTAVSSVSSISSSSSTTSTPSVSVSSVNVVTTLMPSVLKDRNRSRSPSPLAVIPGEDEVRISIYRFKYKFLYSWAFYLTSLRRICQYLT